MSVDHYENFPVASWLCPPALRPPIVAIYRFARTADDIADEGEATPAERVADLDAYRADLVAVAAGRPPSPRWRRRLRAARARHRRASPAAAAPAATCSTPSARTRCRRATPIAPSCSTTAGARRTRSAGCCCTSHGVADARSLAQSDAICSALQLANFWQDLGVDASRGRLYVPAADARRHGVATDELLARRDSVRVRALVGELVAWARALDADRRAAGAHDPRPRRLGAAPGRPGRAARARADRPPRRRDPARPADARLARRAGDRLARARHACRPAIIAASRPSPGTDGR